MKTSAATKKTLREEVRRSRAQRTPADRDRQSFQLCQQLKSLVETVGATTIAAFYPTDTEPNITDFLEWLLARKLDVYAPVARLDGLMNWIRLSDATAATRGLHNLPEGEGEQLGPELLATVDLILAPAAAVDRHGVRLGWGKGYFDRTLDLVTRQLSHQPSAQLAPMYAVVFDDEVREELPREAHDIPATGAVTPSGVLRFA